MLFRRHVLSALAAAVLLAACGGGGSSGFIGLVGGSGPGDAGGGATPPPSTGALIDPPATVATLPAAAIDAATAQSGLQALSGKAQCDVQVIALNYTTVGPHQESTNASGVLLLPTGHAAACTTPAPLVAYAKGTDVQKPRTLANPQDSETFSLIAMFAAQGYAVVATDYLGYAKSAFPYHPYLHADSEATSVLDAVRAARRAAPQVGGTLSGKLMLTGYSQGGHSSMASQRAAESTAAAEMNVVAGAHLAGPYNLGGATRSGVAILGYQFFVPFMVTAYHKVYGNIYQNTTDIFKPPYAAHIEDLLPSPTLNYTTLITSGALPGANGETPTQARDELFQQAFLDDTMNNPNDGFYLDAVKNTLFGWNPKAPTLLCGGAGDPTVPPALHLLPMKADFDSRGVTTVSTVDVDPQIQAAFGPGGNAPTDPTSAAYATYYGNYHGTYEPPFCLAAARRLFDSVK